MIGPYGGKLVERFANQKEAERILSQADEFKHIRAPEEQIYDAEKIGIGAYSPL